MEKNTATIKNAVYHFDLFHRTNHNNIQTTYDKKTSPVYRIIKTNLFKAQNALLSLR